MNSSLLTTLVPMIAVFAIFYFIFIGAVYRKAPVYQTTYVIAHILRYEQVVKLSSLITEIILCTVQVDDTIVADTQHQYNQYGVNTD